MPDDAEAAMRRLVLFVQRTKDCFEAKNYKPSEAGTRNVAQSANIDSAAVSNLPNDESIGNVENAVRIDEDASGTVKTTQSPTTPVVNGGWSNQRSAVLQGQTLSDIAILLAVRIQVQVLVTTLR